VAYNLTIVQSRLNVTIAHARMHAHNHFTALLGQDADLQTAQLMPLGWAGTRNENQSGFTDLAGPYANLHLDPDT